MIVGLGNPGPTYANTRHNVGFMVTDEVGRRLGVESWKSKDRALQAHVRARDVVLVKPQSYMNESGVPTRLIAAWYRIPAERILIVYDELDLPWGTLRIRPGGSAAGHNGVKSLISSLGTMKFARVRMGIDLPGRDRTAGEGKKFVLGRFSRARKQEVEEAVSQGAQAVESILAEGVEKSMAVFNRRAPGLSQEEE